MSRPVTTPDGNNESAYRTELQERLKAATEALDMFVSRLRVEVDTKTEVKMSTGNIPAEKPQADEIPSDPHPDAVGIAAGKASDLLLQQAATADAVLVEHADTVAKTLALEAERLTKAIEELKAAVTNLEQRTIITEERTSMSEERANLSDKRIGLADQQADIAKQVRHPMIAIIMLLLVAWLAFIIIGFAVKTLIWLAIVGVVLFVVTSIAGLAQHYRS